FGRVAQPDPDASREPDVPRLLEGDAPRVEQQRHLEIALEESHQIALAVEGPERDRDPEVVLGREEPSTEEIVPEEPAERIGASERELLEDRHAPVHDPRLPARVELESHGKGVVLPEVGVDPPEREVSSPIAGRRLDHRDELPREARRAEEVLVAVLEPRAEEVDVVLARAGDRRVGGREALAVHRDRAAAEAD